MSTPTTPAATPAEKKQRIIQIKSTSGNVLDGVSYIKSERSKKQYTQRNLAQILKQIDFNLKKRGVGGEYIDSYVAPLNDKDQTVIYAFHIEPLIRKVLKCEILDDKTIQETKSKISTLYSLFNSMKEKDTSFKAFAGKSIFQPVWDYSADKIASRLRDLFNNGKFDQATQSFTVPVSKDADRAFRAGVYVPFQADRGAIGISKLVFYPEIQKDYIGFLVQWGKMVNGAPNLLAFEHAFDRMGSMEAFIPKFGLAIMRSTVNLLDEDGLPLISFEDIQSIIPTNEARTLVTKQKEVVQEKIGGKVMETIDLGEFQVVSGYEGSVVKALSIYQDKDLQVLADLEMSADAQKTCTLHLTKNVKDKSSECAVEAKTTNLWIVFAAGQEKVQVMENFVFTIKKRAYQFRVKYTLRKPVDLQSIDIDVATAQMIAVAMLLRRTAPSSKVYASWYTLSEINMHQPLQNLKQLFATTPSMQQELDRYNSVFEAILSAKTEVSGAIVSDLWVNSLKKKKNGEYDGVLICPPRSYYTQDTLVKIPYGQIVQQVRIASEFLASREGSGENVATLIARNDAKMTQFAASKGLSEENIVAFKGVLICLFALEQSNEKNFDNDLEKYCEQGLAFFSVS